MRNSCDACHYSPRRKFKAPWSSSSPSPTPLLSSPDWHQMLNGSESSVKPFCNPFCSHYPASSSTPSITWLRTLYAHKLSGWSFFDGPRARGWLRMVVCFGPVGSGGDVCFGHVGNFACGLSPVRSSRPLRPLMIHAANELQSSCNCCTWFAVRLNG